MFLLTALVLVTITAWTLTGLFAIDALHDTDNPYECDCCEAAFPTVARFAAHVCDRETAAEAS